MRFAVDIKVRVRDHVHQDQSADLVQCSLGRKLLSEVPTAVQTIRVGPTLQGFLSVEEDEPVGEYVLSSGQDARHFQQKRGAGSTVIGTYEGKGRAFRVVMARDDDDCRAGTGNLRDEVGHWDRPNGRRGREGVQDHGGASCVEFARDEVSALFQGWRSWRPGPEAD